MPVAAKRKPAIASPDNGIINLSEFVPRQLRDVDDPQTLIPRLAKDEESVASWGRRLRISSSFPCPKPLARRLERAPVGAIDSTGNPTREADSQFRLRDSNERATELEYLLRTGRAHFLRVETS